MLARLFYLLQRLALPPHASLAFTPDGVRVLHGAPAAAWIADCADVARDFGLAVGRLDVVGDRSTPRLRFSPELPAACHQRLRNVLGVHRAAFLQPAPR